MATSLQLILRGLTVFPYDTVTMDSLSKSCQSYSSEIAIADFEGCLLYLCQGECYKSFISFIEEEAGTTFPYRVYRGLAGYVVSLVLEDENLSEQKKVLFSLMVRNVMVFSFFSSDDLIKKCISPQIYTLYDEYWNAQAAIGSLPKSELFPKVFTSDSFDQLGCSAEDVFPAVKILAKQNERFEYFKAVSEIKQDENEDDFVYAVRVVNEIQSYDWEYVDPNPVETLKKTGLKSQKRMTLEQIRNVVDTDDLATEDFSPSSLLLHCLYNGNSKLATYKMNPLHFAVALYYEWMFESLKERNNG